MYSTETLVLIASFANIYIFFSTFHFLIFLLHDPLFISLVIPLTITACYCSARPSGEYAANPNARPAA